jgi:hypothetical protein
VCAVEQFVGRDLRMIDGMRRTTDTIHLRNGARRRRPLLLTLTALGVTTGLLGFAGVLAIGSDTAETGKNDVRSGELPGLDIQLASASYDFQTTTFTCGSDYADHLESGVITSDGATLDEQYPGFPNYDEGWMCLRNNSDVPVDVHASTIDVVDVELACSPGEADAPDPTCGAGEGELSSGLTTGLYRTFDGDENACLADLTAVGTIAGLEDGASTIPVGTIEPGGVLGLCAGVTWTPDAGSQSDQAEWRYVFEAVESDGPPDPEPVDCSAPSENYEPNDTLAAPASGYSILPGDAIGSHVCPEDRDDYWQAGANDAGQATIYLDWADEAADLDLVAYSANGEVLASSVLEEGTHEEVTVPLAELAVVRVHHWTGPAQDYTVGLSEPFGAP